MDDDGGKGAGRPRRKPSRAVVALAVLAFLGIAGVGAYFMAGVLWSLWPPLGLAYGLLMGGCLVLLLATLPRALLRPPGEDDPWE